MQTVRYSQRATLRSFLFIKDSELSKAETIKEDKEQKNIVYGELFEKAYRTQLFSQFWFSNPMESSSEQMLLAKVNSHFT